MYDLIDTFSIVIGPSDINSIYQEPDLESEQILRNIPDPQNKIIIAAIGQWSSKDDMTYVATKNLNHDIVMQLDADEFWPHATFLKAIEQIKVGADRVGVPHWTFWKNSHFVLGEKLDSENFNYHYFCHFRIFKRKEKGILKHFALRYEDDSQPADTLIDIILSDTDAIWHANWIGNERVKRKFNFYWIGRSWPMPRHEIFANWKYDNNEEITIFNHIVYARPYPGPPIPQELAKLIDTYDDSLHK